MGTFDIIVEKVNEVYLRLKCKSEKIYKNIENLFSIFQENYRFNPKYKMGIWDGKIRFFDFRGFLFYGLLEELKNLVKDRYKIKIDFEEKNNINFKELDCFLEEEKKKFLKEKNIILRSYQINAVYEALKRKRINIEIPTGGGKSLIIYLITKFLFKKNYSILIIVNTTTLVEQLFDNFMSFGFEDEKLIRLYSIYKRNFENDFNKNKILISTWQSLIKIKDKNFFEQFNVLIIDEAHSAKANSIALIGKKCINAEYRLGFSGTFHKEKSCSWYTTVGILGPIKKFITLDELKKQNFISDFKIFIIMLDYSKKIKKDFFENCSLDYNRETEFIIKNKLRIDFLKKLIFSRDKNTLILFSRIEYGKELFNLLRNSADVDKIDKKIYYIDGSIETQERNKIRKEMEENNNIILLASYGTFSVGIDIKNIHNIVLANGYKSKIKILQSIGRGLRKIENKELCVFDIIDNLIYRNRINFSIRHYKERIKIYEENNFNIIKKKYFLKDKE